MRTFAIRVKDNNEGSVNNLIKQNQEQTITQQITGVSRFYRRKPVYCVLVEAWASEKKNIVPIGPYNFSLSGKTLDAARASSANSIKSYYCVSFRIT